MTVVDDSLTSIDVTLWGNFASFYLNEADEHSSIVDSQVLKKGSLICFKDAKISEF